jgi:hypothetical protein
MGGDIPKIGANSNYSIAPPPHSELAWVCLDRFWYHFPVQIGWSERSSQGLAKLRKQ